MTGVPAPILPGRLGSPGMVLKDDPRADPRMIAAMAPLGLAEAPAPMPVDANSSLDELLEVFAMVESGFEELFGALAMSRAPAEGVTTKVEVIRGIDGNDITLFVHRPREIEGPLPGVVHIHGGGMVMLEAAGAGYAHWRADL